MSSGYQGYSKNGENESHHSISDKDAKHLYLKYKAKYNKLKAQIEMKGGLDPVAASVERTRKKKEIDSFLSTITTDTLKTKLFDKINETDPSLIIQDKIAQFLNNINADKYYIENIYPELKGKIIQSIPKNLINLKNLFSFSDKLKDKDIMSNIGQRMKGLKKETKTDIKIKDNEDFILAKATLKQKRDDYDSYIKEYCEKWSSRDRSACGILYNK